MTVSYNLDVSSVSLLAFAKLLCKWKGSIVKSVRWELAVWILLYYTVAFVYRRLLSSTAQEIFDDVAKHLDQKLILIPLTFMLGFFVNIVVDRWKQILQNMAFIENVALSVSTLIRGTEDNVRLSRRSIIRYLVLSQVLVLRDISMRVRRRFPTMKSLVEAGFIFENELKDLDATSLKYNKFWVPVSWANHIIYQMHLEKRIDTPVSMNNVLNNVKEFRSSLESLCKFDWVPIPIAYPQVVFLAVRAYFLVCLVSRQYLVRPKDGTSENPIDFYIPLMSILEFIFLVGWMKVAEALLNPLGEDDDDFEGNWVIDKNIQTGMAIVDDAHQRHPNLNVDKFADPQFSPMYSADSAHHGLNNSLKGSAAAVRFADEDSKMVKLDSQSAESDHERKDSTMRRRLNNLSLHLKVGRSPSKTSTSPASPRARAAVGFADVVLDALDEEAESRIKNNRHVEEGKKH